MSITCDDVNMPLLQPRLAKLLKAIEEEQLHMHELAKLVELDAGLATRVLRMANSSFFGMSGRIADLHEAMLMIGLANTRDIILAEILFKRFEQPPWDRINLQPFWRTSLSMACMCLSLSRYHMVPPAQAYCAGLLHNIGQLALIMQAGDLYAEVLEKHLPTTELVAWESMVLGTTHAQVGAELLGQWQLSSELCRALSDQYNEVSPEALTEVLAASHLLVPWMGADSLPDDMLTANALVVELAEQPELLKKALKAAQTRYTTLLEVLGR